MSVSGGRPMSASGRPSSAKPTRNVSAADFPSKFLLKVQQHWAKIPNMFISLDMDRSGKISPKEFERVLEGISCDLTQRELELVIKIFDLNGDGEVDQQEFITVMGRLLRPPVAAEGFGSLNFTPNFRPKRPEGRGKNFKELKSAWNNDYHQTLDKDGNGKPVLENLLQGHYYLTKTNPYARPGTSAEPGYGATAKGTQLDPRKPSQAMVKSLIQGDFYENRPRTSDGDKGIDFIRHNRKMTGEYSRLIAGTRSNSRLSNAAVSRQERHMLESSLSVGPYQTSVLAGTLQGGSAATPRNAQELQEMWGRPLDPKFIATTLAWLGRASPAEKTQFKGAVQYPTAISAKPGMLRGPSRAGNKSSGGSPWLGGSSGIRGPGSRPQSATGVRRPSEAASPFSAAERPASRTGIDRGAIEAATAFARSRPRPSSAMSSRPASATYGARPSSAMGRSVGAFRAPAASRGGSRQGGNDIGQVLQKATVGATWAAPLADGNRS